ncbi:MAG TPA: Asp-tRNA(Asn)/Glu-tRNA(Gln) amidotransferase subunit GatB [Opitutales bacterium]|nr:Asp-tRNA(Asn)/Glu-tRNA(Gln) amidotransferase subunit GatB [Opitutales bacterium]
MSYEVIIGLEVHVQLKTKAKAFCPAPYVYGEEPNTLCDPVVLALPGTLPVINKAAIDLMIKMGLMFGCEIAAECKWDRKNYWYPDSPKNYQISQYDQPLCKGGAVEIELPGASRSVCGEHKMMELTRIHLEEDPAKLNHSGHFSLIDDNRTGASLAEIVTEPVFRSADEAAAFIQSLRLALSQQGISDCDMEKGQMRCDANVSVRPVGETKLYTRTESKNLNSMSAVKACIEAESKRQIALYEAGRGHEIVQETRRWDAEAGVGYTMRSKEDSQDYRYFPDPDLMPVRVDEAWKNAIRATIGELPYARQKRYMEVLGLSYPAASALITDLALSNFFEEAVRLCDKPQEIANYVVNDLLRELAAAGAEGEGPMPLAGCRLSPAFLAELVKLTADGVITKQVAHDVFVESFQSGEAPLAIVDKKGLRTQKDEGELEKLARAAIEADPAAVAKVKAGNDKAINALKGPIMKATRGKADPKTIDELLRRLVAEM